MISTIYYFFADMHTYTVFYLSNSTIHPYKMTKDLHWKSLLVAENKIVTMSD